MKNLNFHKIKINGYVSVYTYTYVKSEEMICAVQRFRRKTNIK